MPKIRHKIQFDVNEQLWREMQETIPWGMRRLIYEALTKTICDYIKEVGPAEALGQLTTYGTGVKELMKRSKANGPDNTQKKRESNDRGGTLSRALRDALEPTEEARGL